MIYDWAFVWDDLPGDMCKCNTFGEDDRWYVTTEDVFITDGTELLRCRGFYTTTGGEAMTSFMRNIIAWIPAELFKKEVIPRYVCPPLPSVDFYESSENSGAEAGNAFGK